MSSIASYLPVPKAAVYAATKSYNYFLSMALSEEYDSSNLDILCSRPSDVKTAMQTKMMNDNRGPDGFITISTLQHVTGTLNDLGYEKETDGYWTHKIKAYIVSFIPYSMAMLAIKKIKNK